jgi:flagellar basal-body rod modification protein FlgD
MAISNLATLNTGATGTAKASDAAKKAQENQDRFLTLLVAQMKNQDPMNPMENAQLTSQIAQIQTVTGIDQLNNSIQSMSNQFSQNQTMQGVGMIGRDVTLAGNRLQLGKEGAVGTFELSGTADNISVDILTPAGTVVDTVQLGAANSGRHSFSWSKEGYTPNSELNFRINATRGATKVAATTFSRDQVVAVDTANGRLGFTLASGKTTTFDKILSVD